MRLLSLFLIVFTSLAQSLYSQTKDIPQGYAIVVGAYAKSQVELAVKFTKQVSNEGYDARFGLNERGSLIYVYVDHTESFKEAIAKMKEMRTKEGFGDSWVHVKTSEARLQLSPEEQKRAEETTQALKKEVVNPLGDLYAERFKNVEKDEPEEEEVPKKKKEEVTEKPKAEEESISEVEKEEIAVEKDDRLEVKFELTNSTDGSEVKGELQIIDTERSKLMDVVESGHHVHVDDPKNGSGQITVIVDVFGFRKVQKEFNYYDPINGTTNAEIDSTENGLVLNFDLVRYRKGDIITMYNVFYYKDAAVMRPESKYEVNSLLDMLQENKNMRIKIHGHVNGKHAGPIISVIDDQFFNLSNDNPKGFGSAKKLSKERAETIRDYLVSKGISEDRMEIKAWGGNRMLHDKHSTKAKQNVRVEIEILDE
ncbi:OmpA family protein [Fulvivirga lutea]|uniref:OmpA family protein n=1 Tax=Fulvivirga lutea TaxID=2810512 RepID=A0A974WFN2_9BACT|nr:OmpA family protein [Fulvivirga lutea]QSE97366.1 OmpA family protein [Fulvivirga lutea]